MNKCTSNTIGRRIAAYRKINNLTQTELGNILGRSQAVISGWEKGSDPGCESLVQIANALGVTPNDLLGYKPPEGVKQVVMPDDSMEPHIRKGDVLTIETDAVPADGDTVIVDTSKHKGLIRKLFRIGAQTLLLSVNPSVSPIGVHYADIIGKVTEIHRKL